MRTTHPYYSKLKACILHRIFQKSNLYNLINKSNIMNLTRKRKRRSDFFNPFLILKKIKYRQQRKLFFFILDN